MTCTLTHVVTYSFYVMFADCGVLTVESHTESHGYSYYLHLDGITVDITDDANMSDEELFQHSCVAEYDVYTVIAICRTIDKHRVTGPDERKDMETWQVEL